MTDKDKIRELKKTIFLTAYRANVGAHLASAFSVIDVLYVLYCRQVLHCHARAPWEASRDRLIMSKGHASLALYVVLHEAGFISNEELNSFCQPGSKLGGEPKLGAVPGIEASTGSLGHGFSFAVGVAMACRINHYGNRVYVILGDGECQEGTVWEAAMSAVKFQLDNLVVIMDDNRLQAMDTVEEIMGISSWRERWEAFGFDVDEVNGHDLQEIENSLRKKNDPGKPRLIISHTIKGKGVSFMEGVPIWHYRMPNGEELEIIKEELGILEEELMR